MREYPLIQENKITRREARMLLAFCHPVVEEPHSHWRKEETAQARHGWRSTTDLAKALQLPVRQISKVLKPLVLKQVVEVQHLKWSSWGRQRHRDVYRIRTYPSNFLTVFDAMQRELARHHKGLKSFSRIYRLESAFLSTWVTRALPSLRKEARREYPRVHPDAVLVHWLLEPRKR